MGKPQTGQERDTNFYNRLLVRYGECFVRTCDDIATTRQKNRLFRGKFQFV
ncbi:MAG: hypothetical protein HY513_00760 [Candidatus Aenigmarchaeota archaeon]|nr:hypothetical protein [Candidatus Aenigmarchaeota archaeon]